MGFRGRADETVRHARAAETVVTGDQVKFNRIGGISREELLDELTAPARQNHCILETVEDRRLHQPESVEAGLPIGLAFLNPFPRERPIFVQRVVIPRHPAGRMPIMLPLGVNRSGAQTHHIERGGDEEEFSTTGNSCP